MSQEAIERYVAALTKGKGLHDDFIYSMTFDEYKTFPDPYPRTTFKVTETEARISRYSNPGKPGELFEWDIHGRFFTLAKLSIPGIAVVMVPGGVVNEYEFIFTPDGPEKYLDLTKTSPTESRVGVAQHMASLGIPVLAISLPGHYSRSPWPPIPDRRPEFIIGEIPSDEELKNRLAVYTFRMCVEAIKVLITSTLPYDSHPYLREGMSVEVVRGPLEGLRGVLLRKDKRHRLVISVHLIQQAASVEIDAGDVVSV